ncbi:hypothetical protein [Priestia sp. YIM B13491]|uniref:hypothetical protein n=1 Tax=Priestia sp. YIM B13491 TaxID=3366312 RepID=UPI003673089C
MTTNKNVARESFIKQIAVILDEMGLKYKKIESEGMSGFEFGFENDYEEPLDLALYISEKPYRINFIVPNVVDLDMLKDGKYVEVLKKINNINSEKILYGSLGIADEINSVIYSNAVSLEGRSSIEQQELMDYILYSVFITEAAIKEINQFLYREDLRVK